MNLEEFSKVTIDTFKGLYKRGIADQCPSDHAICCQNCDFTNPGQFSKRPGVAVSLVLSWQVVQQYLATFPSYSTLVTLDVSGNLYSGNNPTPIYSLTGMFDFHLLNVYGRVYILPITNLFPAPNLLVWDGVNPVRQALGFAPTTTFSAADGASDPTGGLDPGVHLFAVCYLTNTGFTTQPGPKIMGVFTAVSYTAPGLVQVNLSGIPTGPSPQTVGRIILATKANETEFFYVPGGQINDNTTTTLTLDFFDTSLAISADSLFDLLEFLPCQAPTGTGSGMLATYNGRVVVATGKQVWVSIDQEPEAFDNVVGFINVPALAANNVAIGVFVLLDVLYFTCLIGIYSTQDNLGDPGTWDVVIVDGAITAYKNGISTISSASPALGVSETVLLAHREGLFIFNGNAQRPELSWKIKDIWDTITVGQYRNIMVSVDFYRKLIYVLLPVNNSLVPNVMLMADYSEMNTASLTSPASIDKNNIKWTYHFFPFIPLSIGMAFFTDQDGISASDYFLRIGSASDNNLYKLVPGLLNDDGDAIDTRYCCYLATVQQGAINLFRALRFRARGNGTMSVRLNSEDFSTALQQTPNSLTIPLNPAQEYVRQINFMNEKLTVQVSNANIDEQMTVDRIDIFAKRIFAARPQ
jgi:hypothetical protein